MLTEKVIPFSPVEGIALTDRIKALEEAIKKTREYLIHVQDEEGYWVGNLEADASVSAGYIPLMYFMTGKVDPIKQAKVINYVRSKQKEDGSWSSYYDGPGDLNVTLQVYFAMKLGGLSASEPFLQKAKDFILSRGGLMKANTITRVWLALFGQFDYRGTPSIPPEMILLPNSFYFNIYEFASWSRETIMALMLVLSTKPICKIPAQADISELYVEPVGKRHYAPAKRDRLLSWKSIFLLGDSIFKKYEKHPIKPLRKIAMKKVENWVLEHQERDGSWGGIMLPWIYSLMALKSLGYKLDHPVIKKGMEGLDLFILEDSQVLRLQPAVSPVWDTAWAVIALLESGVVANDSTLVKSAEWLLEKEIRRNGDWRIKNPRTEPGCWSFEFYNDLYPDIDDTAVVARALLNINLTGKAETLKLEAAKRGLNWVKAMQSSDGGWAAFDRDNNKKVLMNIPYGDFITPLDPTSADVTAHALELLGVLDSKGKSLPRAIEYLKKIQRQDGSWYGRWGVNYLYGTGLVLTSLKSAGEDMGQEYIIKAVEWLISHQNPDGGWGETCETYNGTNLNGTGSSAASQTAWVLMGLIAAGKYSSPYVEKGVEYLLQTQNNEGVWSEEVYTGTGFPRGFYLRYDLYRVYFPLLALCQYRANLEVKNG
jgi:squalene-hopene/tetraprenyl-beta-curcumene cyclase